MKQAFFFDIDGTLYDHLFHEVDPQLYKAFQRMKDNHISLCLVTSRSEQEASHLPSRLWNFPFDRKILDGGAVVLNENNERILEENLTRDQTDRIINFCKEHDLMYRYSSRNGTWFSRQPDGSIVYHWNSLYLMSPEYKEYEGEDCSSILVWCEDPNVQNELCKVMEDCSIVRYPKLVELRTTGCGKEDRIEKFILENRIGKSVAIGDGHNDVNMLKTADIGLAMGNACDECKEAADEVIDSVLDGGVAKWLEKKGYMNR